MTNGFGEYTFLPYLRAGLAASMQLGNAASRGRGLVTAEFTVTGRNWSETVRTPPLPLNSAGDITSLDISKIVVRTWPVADAQNVEDNYFPLIEFKDYDFPWLYTPSQPNINQRLTPWLCLIALKDDEFSLGSGPGQRQKFRSIKIHPKVSLPKLAQAWAWAHVQLSGVKYNRQNNLNPDVDSVTLYDFLEKNPGHAISRLLCPRRLESQTAYNLFLVPTLLQGVETGLGKELSVPEDGLKLAWEGSSSGDKDIELPIYYPNQSNQWRFQTGTGGDFEYLVSLLTNYVVPSTVGTRPIDVSTPGSNLPPAASAPLLLKGALKVPDDPCTTLSPSNDLLSPTWVTAIRGKLNGSTAVPMYGRWHAAQQQVLDPDANDAIPPWFHQLNVDPSLRVAAALGTAVVQSQQQALMASAWQQAKGIREINNELRQAQTAREMAVRLYERHFDINVTDDQLDVDGVLLLTAPLFDWFSCGTASQNLAIHDLFSQTRIIGGVTDPQWRRVSRPLGPASRRQGRQTDVSTRLFERMNNGEIILVSPPRPRSNSIIWEETGLTRYEELDLGNPAPNIPRDPHKPQRLNEIEISYWDPDLGLNIWSEFSAAFREAFEAIFAPKDDITPPLQPNISEIARCIVDRIEPRRVINHIYESRLTIRAGAWRGDDLLSEVWAAPTFPDPMYAPLRDLSQDWMLPGLDKVPPNTVTLLETNPDFIEAYMVGLNHEMARELLWHGYPTDQRGSYFRQFWDPKDYLGENGQPPTDNQKRDINFLDKWTYALGLNENPEFVGVGKETLVLLIRGELLRRYPTAQVYAIKATWKDVNNHKAGHQPLIEQDGITIKPENQRHPVFSGTLQPDVSFFRFDLTIDQVRSTDTDAGWFFVMQEPGHEIRFGLDTNENIAYGSQPEKWSDLSWQHLLGSTDYRYLDLATPTINPTAAASTDPPQVFWNTGEQYASPSNIAWITLQRPTRVAIHGDRLLPVPQPC